MEPLGNLFDQIQSSISSLYNEFELYFSKRDLDEAWQNYNTMYSDNIGCQEPERYYNPYDNQMPQYYTEPLDIYSHSPLPVNEPILTESLNLEDMLSAFLSSPPTSSPTDIPMEQVYKEQTDILRHCSDMLSKMLTQLIENPLGYKESEDQVRLDPRPQESENYPHTKPTIYELVLHKDGREYRIRTDQSPFSPRPFRLPDQSSHDDKFVLEELSQPIPFNTPGKSDEEESVDEEIEVERPEVKTYIGDSASTGLKEFTPTKPLDSEPIQTDLGYKFSQPLVTDYNSQIFLNWSLFDLQNISNVPSSRLSDEFVVTSLETKMETIPPPNQCDNIPIGQGATQVSDKVVTSLETTMETIPPPNQCDNIPIRQEAIQVSDEFVVTRLETTMETIPPPNQCNNISIRKEDIRSKEGSRLRILRESLNQPTPPTIEDERKMAEDFLSPPVEQIFHVSRLSHLIGHILIVTCFKLLGMYRYFHPPIKDPTDPLKLASK